MSWPTRCGRYSTSLRVTPDGFSTEGPQLTRFWDVSGKRSLAMRSLARELGGVDVGIAQSFGLFCDVGIALLMQRFPLTGHDSCDG
jgi:HD-like signal output (HDOD) protein